MIIPCGRPSKVPMKKVIPVHHYYVIKNIFGVADTNIKFIEKEFGVEVLVNKDSIEIEGRGKEFKKACALIEFLIDTYRNENATIDKIKEHVAYFHGNIHAASDIKISLGKKVVHPRTTTQLKYLKAIAHKDVVFAIGPAGTGKTYLSVAMAVHALASGRVQRLILTRPAVEAGESLGYLPGGISEKLYPYLRPLYDALYEMMDFSKVEEYAEKGIIEIAPLAYMRGRTLSHAFVILDEAQNCTTKQLKMFITRLGFGSKMVITADATQTDLPGGQPVGLLETLKILKPIKEVGFIHLTSQDVIRHELVKKIIRAYDTFYKES